MIFSILAAAELVKYTPRSLVVILVLLIYAFIFGLVIIGLVRLVRYLGSAKNEQKLMRMELSKLAEEVHLIRQELKGGKEQDSSGKSSGDS